MAECTYLHAPGAAGERGADRVLGWFGADMILRIMSVLGIERIV